MLIGRQSAAVHPDLRSLSARPVRPVTGRSHAACDSIRFSAIDAGRIHPTCTCAAPAWTLMDEADGRTGHVARQSGHLDALPDVPALSLRLPDPSPQIEKNSRNIQGETQ